MEETAVMDYGGHVLLVCSRPAVSRACEGMLERGGFRVDPVDSRDSALAALNGIKYDAILCDNTLEREGDGPEFLRTVKGSRPDTVGLLILSVASEGYADFPYITKPCRQKELCDFVGRHIE